MSVLLDRDGIAALVPHGGAMCLWDELLAADEHTVSLRTLRHRDAAHPLRRDGRLAALHLIEYGAQAMAVHGGWLARRVGGAGAKPGVLAAVRDVVLEVERIDDIDAALEGQARRLVANAGGWMYEFRLEAGGRLLASGRASVIHAAGSSA
jgi:predicted hotdog family 3-hydroxylacyl-ACP dehydratase